MKQSSSNSSSQSSAPPDFLEKRLRALDARLRASGLTVAVTEPSDTTEFVAIFPQGKNSKKQKPLNVRRSNKLVEAILSGSVKDVRDAIKGVLDVNCQVEFDGPTRRDTPISLAISTGNHEIVGALLAGGANPNKWDRFHYFPLHNAVISSDTIMCQLLLSAGADVNGRSDVYRGEGGYTALHFSAWHPNIDIVKLLLEFGADPYIRDRSFPSKTALQNIRKEAPSDFFLQVIELINEQSIVKKSKKYLNFSQC